MKNEINVNDYVRMRNFNNNFDANKSIKQILHYPVFLTIVSMIKARIYRYLEKFNVARK